MSFFKISALIYKITAATINFLGRKVVTKMLIKNPEKNAVILYRTKIAFKFVLIPLFIKSFNPIIVVQ